MKINNHRSSAWLLAVFGVLSISQAHAATVSGGALVLNLNRDVLIASLDVNDYPDTPTADFPICCRPSIYLEEFYDASAASKTFVELRDGNTPDLYDTVADEIPATGLQFSVNGVSPIVNPGGRQNRNTTFAFEPGNLFGTASGSIGLGGVMRFRVDVDPPTNRVLLGDMTLEYDPALEAATPGRTGWVITNHIGFDAGGFELFDVTTAIVGNTLSLNGNLGLGWGFDHLGARDARLRDTRIGTFSFQTTVVSGETPAAVPLPAAVWLFAGGLAGLFLNNRSDKRMA
ncbi:hypothetical protein JWZ98_18615 [Methylomonas sp. EFPC1]|uniref:hypothetical protein n=1 Tax=Methylomonas sp. EFPC1 TaxID=2812647 RepID=UPI00196856F2|nr:hypothetical protein [Methylomonas sp. EFPC1]QSB00650.1 hypothetical protein JWZ98_18615 [Methylomonas sp. EFPC1]